MKVGFLFAICACTSLGPMPATTGVSALPAGRPGAEAQVGVMPGFRLSDAAHEAKANGIAQLSALVDLDRLLLPGLIFGARVYGPDHDTYVEPYLGYRRRFDRVSLAGVAFGTKGSAEQYGASYKATRAGGELAADVIVVQPVRWLTFHVQGAASATYIKASGRYCVDAEGVATDCSENGPNTFVDGRLHGTYVAGTVTIAADVGRIPSQIFHEVRVAFLMAAGSMPRVRNGEQQSANGYAAAGLTLTVGFGAKD